MLWIFKIFQNQILLQANFKNSIIYKPSLGSREVFGLEGFSRFDVHWIQTNRQRSKVQGTLVPKIKLEPKIEKSIAERNSRVSFMGSYTFA